MQVDELQNQTLECHIYFISLDWQVSISLDYIHAKYFSFLRQYHICGPILGIQILFLLSNIFSNNMFVDQRNYLIRILKFYCLCLFLFFLVVKLVSIIFLIYLKSLYVPIRRPSNLHSSHHEHEEEWTKPYGCQKHSTQPCGTIRSTPHARRYQPAKKIIHHSSAFHWVFLVTDYAS